MPRIQRTLRRRTPQVSNPARGDVRLAAIDIGSNSIHMIVAQLAEGGAITTLWRLKEMVGLGRISFPSRRLSADAIHRAMLTLRHFQQFAQQKEAEKIVAVATSAVREAENGGDFIERVRAELGLHIKVVSGKDEARLIYLGVRHAMDLAAGAHLLVDVGGGSVEFIVADQQRALLLESLKLGSARMTARFIKSDPVNSDDLEALRRHYKRELTPLCAQIQALEPVGAIGCSGTLENLSAMCGSSKNDDLPQGAVGVIERQDLDKLVDRLVASRPEDRAALSGLDSKRQDQIVAGAVLVKTLFRLLKLKKMFICRTALREGILIDHLSRHLPEMIIRRDVPDPRRRSILDLARRCHWHESHSRHVAHLVLRFFDALKPLHHLGRRARELIEYGALLHDIGWHIAASAHHKHAMYLIMNGGLKGFSNEEISIIANLARYHRKSPPKPEHDAYASLSAKAQQIVLTGAAILRICDGLDRSHCSVINDIQVVLGNRRVRVRLQARGDTELELWASRRKMDVFEQVFHRTLSFAPSRRK